MRNFHVPCLPLPLCGGSALITSIPQLPRFVPLSHSPTAFVHRKWNSCLAAVLLPVPAVQLCLEKGLDKNQGKNSLSLQSDS